MTPMAPLALMVLVVPMALVALLAYGSYGFLWLQRNWDHLNPRTPNVTHGSYE
jgi:hypothetical protein